MRWTLYIFVMSDGSNNLNESENMSDLQKTQFSQATAHATSLGLRVIKFDGVVYVKSSISGQFHALQGAK